MRFRNILILLHCSPASAILEALSRLSVVYQDSSLISTGHSHQAQQHQGRKPSASGVEDEQSTEVITDPCKWPGVTSLRALLDREKDEETPSLSVLLCETFVAVYLSLFSYALSSCDAQVRVERLQDGFTLTERSLFAHRFSTVSYLRRSPPTTGLIFLEEVQERQSKWRLLRPP